jgi:hypothetical protein
MDPPWFVFGISTRDIRHGYVLVIGYMPAVLAHGIKKPPREASWGLMLIQFGSIYVGGVLRAT